MKHLVKAAVAAALVMGAGVANASIDYVPGSDRETFMAAYDWTTGKTFNYDTGVRYSEWLANKGTDYNLSFDFSNDANWGSFITGAAVDKIKWVVAVGNSELLGAAVTAKQPLFNDVNFNFVVPGSLEARAIDMNAKMGPINPAVNTSSLVSDYNDPGFSGQYTTASTLWGAWSSSQEVEGGYGETVAFRLGEFFMDASDENNIILRNDETLLGHWTLDGNRLSFKSYMKPSDPAPVPLPAAVWMFGAGLMGLLRTTRRK